MTTNQQFFLMVAALFVIFLIGVRVAPNFTGMQTADPGCPPPGRGSTLPMCDGNQRYLCNNGMKVLLPRMIGRCGIECKRDLRYARPGELVILDGDWTCRGKNWMHCRQGKWVNVGQVVGVCGVRCQQGKCEGRKWRECNKKTGRYSSNGEVPGKCGVPECREGDKMCKGAGRKELVLCENGLWVNKGVVTGNCGVECINTTLPCFGKESQTCVNNKIRRQAVKGVCGAECARESKCEGNNYFVCMHGEFENKGKIAGKCGQNYECYNPTQFVCRNGEIWNCGTGLKQNMYVRTSKREKCDSQGIRYVCEGDKIVAKGRVKGVCGVPYCTHNERSCKNGIMRICDTASGRFKSTGKSEYCDSNQALHECNGDKEINRGQVHGKCGVVLLDQMKEECLNFNFKLTTPQAECQKKQLHCRSATRDQTKYAGSEYARLAKSRGMRLWVRVANQIWHENVSCNEFTSGNVTCCKKPKPEYDASLVEPPLAKKFRNQLGQNNCRDLTIPMKWGDTDYDVCSKRKARCTQKVQADLQWSAMVTNKYGKFSPQQLTSHAVFDCDKPYDYSVFPIWSNEQTAIHVLTGALPNAKVTCCLPTKTKLQDKPPPADPRIPKPLPENRLENKACKDSDNGNPFVFGKLQYKSEVFQDTCILFNKYVKEYNCNPDGKPFVELRYCTNGCIHGECAPNAPSTTPASAQCKDSDQGVREKAGTLTRGTKQFSDACALSNKYVKEFGCFAGTTPYVELLRCYHGCKAGACIA